MYCTAVKSNFLFGVLFSIVHMFENVYRLIYQAYRQKNTNFISLQYNFKERANSVENNYL